MKTIERRFTNLKTLQVRLEKRGADQSPMIVGYASVFFNEADPEGTEYALWDDLRERIMPGAFDRALREDDVRCLLNHDTNYLLGRSTAGTLRLSVDSTGLRYEDDPPDTTVGRDTLESLRRGDLTGSSFAFCPTEITWRQVDDLTIREVRAVQLMDVGPVVYPAYDASTAGLRSAGEPTEARAAAEQFRREQSELAGRLAAYRIRAESLERD